MFILRCLPLGNLEYPEDLEDLEDLGNLVAIMHYAFFIMHYIKSPGSR